MKATLPDGKSLEFSKGETALDVAKRIGERLAGAAVACRINGELKDIDTPLAADCKFSVVTWKDAEGKEVFWHSASHVMAKAVKRLYPGTKLTIGPPVEEGFYYDFDSEHNFTPEDFAKIEAEFAKIVKDDEKFERSELGTKEAKELFGKIHENYKVEMITELEGMGEHKVSIYRTGADFVDMCRGPHLPSTGKLKAFKIMKNAGAYWHGDINNKMLQRLYALAYPEKKMMDERMKFLEEAEKRDHRKLGRELGIFMTHEWALPGSPFFLNNGAVIYHELQKFMREEYLKRGYQEVITPQMFKKKLCETSCHWEHYR
ncbi:Threonine--tRNA ligase [uncultured archaeon]|nr:Threonine--tRNA ligase [uncultured archaeon]